MTNEPVEFRDARAVRALMNSYRIDLKRAVTAHYLAEPEHLSLETGSEPISIRTSTPPPEQVDEKLSEVGDEEGSTASRTRKAASMSETSESEDEADTSENDPPNMLGAMDYFRVTQPRPPMIRVPSGPDGESRLVHYHSEVDWNSKISVKALNRWRLQAQRRARIKWGGELRRRAMVKYTDKEAKWLEDELSKTPYMSTADIKATIFPRFREKFSETTRSDHALMMYIGKHANLREARGLQATPKTVRKLRGGSHQSSTGEAEDGSKEMESIGLEETDGRTTPSGDEGRM